MVLEDAAGGIAVPVFALAQDPQIQSLLHALILYIKEGGRKDEAIYRGKEEAC